MEGVVVVTVTGSAAGGTGASEDRPGRMAGTILSISTRVGVAFETANLCGRVRPIVIETQ